MSRYEVDRHMDSIENQLLWTGDFIQQVRPGRFDLGESMHNLQLERQYRRERDAEVEAQRRRRLEREGLERLQREYLGGGR